MKENLQDTNFLNIEKKTQNNINQQIAELLQNKR